MSAISHKCLIEIAPEHTRYKHDQFLRSTRIGEDLGLVGDDAYDFLEDLISECGLDANAFDPTLYFPGEVTADMHAYLYRIKLERSQNVASKFYNRLGFNLWGGGTASQKYQTLTLGEIQDALGKT